MPRHNTYKGLNIKQWAERFGKQQYNMSKVVKALGYPEAVRLKGNMPKRNKAGSRFVCELGDRVYHGQGLIMVTQIIEPGSTKKMAKSNIVGCPVVDGVPLTRTNVHAGYDWSFIKLGRGA